MDAEPRSLCHVRTVMDNLVKNAYPEALFPEDTQIRETAVKLAELIVKRADLSPDRDRAVLALRECLMWANQAVNQ